MPEPSAAADHTFVVSDLHLTEAEPPHPGNALWKRYKRPRHFIDRSFGRLIEHLLESLDGARRAELILAGDIFDFDSVMSQPDRDAGLSASWLERLRGLRAEEAKSRFKMRIILRDHRRWIEALRAFIMAGHRVIFIIGNHDLELHWPVVQQAVIEALELPPERQQDVRFCEWFYVSNQDTLVEHGNQYDAYCVCTNPIRPLIRRAGGLSVRLPFGNLACKLMINGMGLFNPHVESSFIMSFGEYLRFFAKYLMRVQPLILWTWLWGAVATLIRSLDDGLRPAVRSPLTLEQRVGDIAQRSNTRPAAVRALLQARAHPAIFNPWRILQELWLDRALLLALLMFVSFNLILLVNAVVPIPVWWVFAPFALLFSGFLFYARSVQSSDYQVQRAALSKLDLSCALTGVERSVHGHTHRELHTTVHGLEHLNAGTWSPAFQDPECRRPYGRKCFIWIQPGAPDGGRTAGLYEWHDPGVTPIPRSMMA